jgi:putative nucleotidyltransferase with HDIG domain
VSITVAGLILCLTLLFMLFSIRLSRPKVEDEEFLPSPSTWEKTGRDLTAPMTPADEREASLEISAGRRIAMEPAQLPGLTGDVPAPRSALDPIASPPAVHPDKRRIRNVDAPAQSAAPPEPEPALLDEVVKGLEQIPPLPKAAQAVLRELDDAGASAKSVADIVASDPVVGAAVLRVVNSAASGMRRRVLTVKEAVAYLGFTNVRAVVMKLKVSQLFRPPPAQTLCYSSDALWQHSLAVAQVADHLAKRTGKADPDLASTLGLLHDIGKLAINSQFPNKVAQLWRPAGLIGGASETWLARERRLFGADHAFMGAFLAARWQLPDDLADAIRLHHLPAEVSLDMLVEPIRRAAQVVHVANQLVKYRHVYCADMEIDAIDPALLSDLGLPADIEQIFDANIERIINHAANLAKSAETTEDAPIRASA